MKRVVAIGEAMVEFAPSGVPDGYTMGFAGDTLNTAWYARRALPADWEVDYVSAVGTDAVSDRMLAFLNEAGIGTAHVARHADATVGLYMIALEKGERSFSYWRGQSAARRLAANPATLAAALRPATLIYLSGITLAILPDEDRARLLAALADAREAGSLIAFDPNLRPRLWPDTQVMCDVITEASAMVDIVLPSHEDEARWFGDASPAGTGRRYSRAGAALVVVKNGPGTILTIEHGRVEEHAAEPVTEVVDTTAAGDSFNAGFLAALLAGSPTEDAVRAGARLAAQVITRRGALVPV